MGNVAGMGKVTASWDQFDDIERVLTEARSALIRARDAAEYSDDDDDDEEDETVTIPLWVARIAIVASQQVGAAFPEEQEN